MKDIVKNITLDDLVPGELYSVRTDSNTLCLKYKKALGTSHFMLVDIANNSIACSMFMYLHNEIHERKGLEGKHKIYWFLYKGNNKVYFYEADFAPEQRSVDFREPLSSTIGYSIEQSVL